MDERDELEMEQREEELTLQAEEAAAEEAVAEEDSLELEAAEDAAEEAVQEDPAMRGEDSAVYRRSDGRRQAVYYAQAVHAYDEEAGMYVDAAGGELIAEEDGRHYRNRAGVFTARFSREAENDELFTVEKGAHRLSFHAKSSGRARSRRDLTGRLSEGCANRVVFAEAAPSTDLEYEVACSRVKETIVIRERQSSYRYGFRIVPEGLTMAFSEEEKTLRFLSQETEEEIFRIPAPFMEDAAGAVSGGVFYEVKEAGDGSISLSVIVDSEWVNAEERVFPVAIDPQVTVSGSGRITTYSWSNGYMYTPSVHTIGMTGSGISCNAQRMYMHVSLPDLPRNPRITKAELVMTQQNGTTTGTLPKIGLYHVTGQLCTGYCTPVYDSDLIDYAVMKTGACDGDGKAHTYAFDITSLIDAVNKNETAYPNLVFKLIDEAGTCRSNVTWYGSSYGSYSPKIVVTYEASYGVRTDESVHTHELGRFGTAGIDLHSGNLMLDSEDFAWGGNRMPVTIRHQYNGALSGDTYTQNSGIGLNVADYSGMKLGYGWRLNYMQSMVRKSFIEDGTAIYGYVYTDEQGEEHYFRQVKTETYRRCYYVNNQCCTYYLYVDMEDEERTYDDQKRELYAGSQTNVFDTSGRLVKIKDEHNNAITLTYTSGKLTSITDGAGREFALNYTAAGYLSSIKAPDDTEIVYTYTNGVLSGVRYPDGRSVTITPGSGNKPVAVLLKDAAGKSVYRVDYSYANGRLATVKEYGYEGTAAVAGQATSYAYAVSARRTVVSTTEAADGEEAANEIKTVYTFNDGGDVVSSYVYTQDSGNVPSGESKGSGINPYAGDGGAGVVSNINNLLVNHNFQSTANWQGEACNCGDLSYYTYGYEPSALYSGTVLRMQTTRSACAGRGVYQTVSSLAAGEYTYSVYIRVVSRAEATEEVTNPGAYLRVTKTDGTVLAESEHLTRYSTEYTRLIVPFTLEAKQSVQVHIQMDGRMTIYADAAQLETNGYANAYNMLENGNFEKALGTEWIKTEGVAQAAGTSFNMAKSLRILGSLETYRHACQIVPVKSYAGTRETFTLSGWAKAKALPEHDRERGLDPLFRLRAMITYSDGTTEDHSASFTPNTEEWQLASVQFSKEKCKVVRTLYVYCEYDYNTGTAYFDDIQLTRESLETGLSTSDFTATDADSTAGEGTAEKEEDNGFKEQYDAYGNARTETTFTDGEFGTIYKAYRYNAACNCGVDGGNDLTAEVDSRGGVTAYDVDAVTSRNEEITDRCGNKTAYAYDENGRTTRVTSKTADGTAIAEVSYGYDPFNNLTGIVRGDGLAYTLKYNAYHNLESIGVSGRETPLVSYGYKKGNGRLKQVRYANGDTMSAAYNGLGQMVAETWRNGAGDMMAHYKYVYDGSGNIVRSIDLTALKEYTYTYEAGKITRSTECDITVETATEIVTGKTMVGAVAYQYDADGNMTKKTVIDAGGNALEYTQENPKDESPVVKFSAGGRTVTSHSKTDSFGRKAFDELQLGKGFLSRQFSYHMGKPTQEHLNYGKLKSSPTTSLVKSIVCADGRTMSYEYDAEERITKVTDSVDGVREYTYDAQGQLTSETVNGVKTAYEYDRYGNILAKGICGEDGAMDEAGKITYTYGDATWKDLLTGLGGQAIAYDEGGNPVSYLGHTLTWEKGRQLKSFDGNAYTYNANGIRTSKTVSGVEHRYQLDGTKIVRETWGGNTLIPLYDNEESVCGVIYNGTPFYFYKNLQGDIIAITDMNGAVKARYTYDAWGVCTITEDNSGRNIAAVNPFRYRGYYFDAEIGMYYLQSRYYDPVVGRFVNADDPQINLMYTVLEINRYAYCINDPINNTDINGNIATFLMKKIGSVLLGLVLGVVSQFLVDVIVSAIRRRWALSSASTYVSAAAQGALDALWGGGIVKEVCKALLSNLLKQLVDMIKNGSNFNFLSLVESIFDGLFNYVLDKAIKTPQFIRDIKKEARKKGLKGTRKLVKFLNTRIRQTKIAKFSISTIFTAVKSFVGDAISFIVKCAKELYQDFISIFSVPSNVPTVNDPGWCC